VKTVLISIGLAVAVYAISVFAIATIRVIRELRSQRPDSITEKVHTREQVIAILRTPTKKEVIA
jgi:hypothetical protein